MKRKIYLLLIIIILTIEFVIIYFGNVKKEQSKIKADTFKTTGQISENKIEEIDTITNEMNILENNINTEDEIIVENNDIIIEENNENDIDIENIVETKDEISIPEDANCSSSFDENTFIDGHLKEYPTFGEQYGRMIIDKIGVDAPIIFGANSETILKGVGHDSGSYFPGENGSIIMCEHNYMNNFNRLGELINGDIIEIKTNYGDFYYSVYDNQIVQENETEKLPIQQGEKLLMIYTCYPFNSVGDTEYRLVVYCRKI